jgi:3-keto-L-gulonate-6-phosphate decarboxylase
MLNKKQRYLQIALNSTLKEAQSIIRQIPLDKRIIIEAGTPLIKASGANGIRKIRFWWEQRIFGHGSEAPPFPRSNPWWLNPLIKSLEKKQIKIKKESSGEKRETSFIPYIVADLKCMDRGAREVKIAKVGGANAAVALGHAPAETLDDFIEKCEEYDLDAMIDMMNVDFPLEVLRQLKKLPQVVILHRGVDEESFNPEKEIPFHEIQRIKSDYDIMIAVAGGDTFEEARRAIFNDADIVVVWKSFYKSAADTKELAEEFLKEIR